MKKPSLVVTKSNVTIEVYEYKKYLLVDTTKPNPIGCGTITSGYKLEV